MVAKGDGVLCFRWHPVGEVRDLIFAIQQTEALDSERDYVVTILCRDADGEMLRPIGERPRWSTVFDAYFVYPSREAGLLRVSWSGDTAVDEVEVRVRPWRKKDDASGYFGVAVIGAGSKPREYEVLRARGEEES